MYHESGGYYCLSKFTFRDASYLAFYHGNEIKPLVPRILDVSDDVILDPNLTNGWARELIVKHVECRPEELGLHRKVIRLSLPDDPRTLKLPSPIRNDTVASTGRRCAFVQGKRYVDSKRLQLASSTSDLV